MQATPRVMETALAPGTAEQAYIAAQKIYEDAPKEKNDANWLLLHRLVTMREKRGTMRFS